MAGGDPASQGRAVRMRPAVARVAAAAMGPCAMGPRALGPRASRRAALSLDPSARSWRGEIRLVSGANRWTMQLAMKPSRSDRRRPPSGWHSRGYLPHFEATDLVQTVVFRLADSLPKQLRNGADPARARTAELADEALDAGVGACWLRQPQIADLVEHALLHFDGERYALLAWCVMPNHVHAMLELRDGFRLGDQVRSWKSYTARRANATLGRVSRFWSADYFDRYIRNDRHYEAALGYIEYNPVKAGLVASPELWPWSSAARR